MNECKRCPRCNATKPLSEFGRNRSRKDGLQAAYDALHQKLQSRGLDYDRFIFSL
jgi:hypothetical protein